MVSKSQYGQREVNACKAVLIELVHLMGEIKDEMVIIGGWTPTFLLPQSDEPHVGSLDNDVALNFSKIPDDTYQTILKAFLKRGYSQDKEQPFRFFRKVTSKGAEPVNVEVDLMAGEYGGTGKLHRTQKVQDVRARKARGCDLAFDSIITITLEGELPEGGKDKVSFKVAGIVAANVDWAEGFNSDAFRNSHRELNELRELDSGLAVSGSCFDIYNGELQLGPSDQALPYFLFRFLQKLQSLGTVPAIDWNAYASVLSKKIT